MSEARDQTRREATVHDQIRDVLERARSGDPVSIPALRAVLDEHPEIWQQYGALATHAQRSWIDLIVGTDLTLMESVTRQLEVMRAELAGPAPSPLESLLVERIVACWLQACYADAATAQSGGVSIRQAELAVKRQDSAHRRYLTAIGSLAMTRRLLAATVEDLGRRADTTSSSTRSGAVISTDRLEQEPIEFKSGSVDGDPLQGDVVMDFVPHAKKSAGRQPGRSRKLDVS